MKKLFVVVLFFLFGGAFIGVAGRQLWLQHCRLKGYQPVEVTILGKRLESRISDSKMGNSRTFYAPRVGYEYTVDGITYENERVTPVDSWGKAQWARSLMEMYRRGESATGYYDPRDPSDSYLVKYYDYSFFIYICIGFFPIAMVIPTAVFHQAHKGNLPAPKRVTAEKYLVSPRKSLSRKAEGAWTTTVIWHAVGLAGLGYSLWISQPPVISDPPIGLLIYEALGLIPLAAALYLSFVRRRFLDPRVFVFTRAFRRGEDFEVAIELPVKSDVHIEELTADLVCMITKRVRAVGRHGESYRKEVLEHHRNSIIHVRNRDAPPGEILRGRAMVQARLGQPPSTPPGTRTYPRYHWLIEVWARLDGKPNYRGKFPIFIEE